MGALKELLRGAKSLVDGMRVTVRAMREPAVTVQYPREAAPMSPVQRNAIRLIEKDETGGSHACIACQMCEKSCPSGCITVVGEKVEGLAQKRPRTFQMNFAACSECGLCLDVCPKQTLGWSTTYDEVGYQPEFVHDLLEEHAEKEESTLEMLREAEAKKKAEREAKRKADQEAKARAAAEKTAQSAEKAAEE